MHPMTSRWAVPAIAALVAGALTVGATLHARASEVGGDSRANQLQVAGAGPQTTTSLAPQTVADLADANIVVRPAGDVSATPAVSAEQAAAVAVRSGYDPAAVAGTATLARVTVADMGPETSADPSQHSTIDPTIKDRLVWVVFFPSVRVPVIGKAGYKGPAFQAEPMVTLVDPQTGEFILSQAY